MTEQLKEILNRLKTAIKEWKAQKRRIVILVILMAAVISPFAFSEKLRDNGWFARFVGALFFSGFFSVMSVEIKLKDKANRIFKALEEYEESVRGCLIESKLTSGGMRKVHFNGKNGIWPGEIVRSGLIHEDEAGQFTSNSYLEGVAAGQRFRFSYIAKGPDPNKPLWSAVRNGDTRGNLFSGKLWVLTQDGEFPCRVAFINDSLRELIMLGGQENAWCERDETLEKYEVGNPDLKKAGICLTDKPNMAKEVLTPEMEARILTYIERHPGEAFYISFVKKNIFFFDFLEQPEEEQPLRPHEIRKNEEPNIVKIISRLRTKVANGKEESENISKYLFDILDIFQEDGVMWNRNEAADVETQSEIDRQLKEVEVLAR